MQTNPWLDLSGLIDSSRYIKGNITALNADGSATISTADGATIRARVMPGQSWLPLAGVLVQSGRIVDSAPALPGVVQLV